MKILSGNIGEGISFRKESDKKIKGLLGELFSVSIESSEAINLAQSLVSQMRAEIMQLDQVPTEDSERYYKLVLGLMRNRLSERLNTPSYTEVLSPEEYTVIPKNTPDMVEDDGDTSKVIVAEVS